MCLSKKISFFIIFIIIYVSNDTLLFGTNKNPFFFYLQFVFLISAMVPLIFVRHSIQKNQIVLVIAFVFLNIGTMLVNFEIDIKYLYEIFVYVLSFLLVVSLDFDVFVYQYKKVMYILSVFSIVLFLVYYFAYGVVIKFPYIFNDADMKFYFFGLGFLPAFSSAIPRSYGIFREPGVYIIFLTLAILFELYYSNLKSQKRVFIYFLALLLTFSTAAYIIIAIIALVYMFYCFKNINNGFSHFKFLFLLAIVFVAVILIFGWDDISNTVFGKLDSSNSSRDSRIGSIVANFNIAKENFMTGKGWTYVIENFGEYAYRTGYNCGHNTNTLLKILAVHGVVYFMLSVYLIFRFWKKVSSSFFTSIILGVIFIIALSNEDLSVNSLIYVLMFYGITNGRSINLDEDCNTEFGSIRQHGQNSI